MAFMADIYLDAVGLQRRRSSGATATGARCGSTQTQVSRLSPRTWRIRCSVG